MGVAGGEGRTWEKSVERTVGVTAVPRVAVLKGMPPRKEVRVVSNAERASVLAGVTITASFCSM
jgi:hypothetical protein